MIRSFWPSNGNVSLIVCENTLVLLVTRVCDLGKNFYINTLSASVAIHIETSQLISTADQLTGFFMRTTIALIGLKEW